MNSPMHHALNMHFEMHEHGLHDCATVMDLHNHVVHIQRACYIHDA